MKTILFPTDFSVNSEQAFLIASSIARDQQANLVVLHVVNQHHGPTAVTSGTLAPSSELVRAASKHFEHLKTLATNFSVTFEVKVGQLFDTIVDEANRIHCDLIVVAGRGHQFPFYQTHGCISEALIRRAPCSVLVLRHFHGEQGSRPADESGDTFKAIPDKCDCRTVASGGVAMTTK